MTETVKAGGDRYRDGDYETFHHFPYSERSRLSELEPAVEGDEQYAAEMAEKARKARATFNELLDAAGGDRNALYEDAKRAWDLRHGQDGQPVTAG